MERIEINNKTQVVHDFMKAKLTELNPGLDLGDDGAFMEMMGLPHIAFLEPIFSTVDKLVLMSSLNNAVNMTEEEFDELAANRHFKQRLPGKYARGVVVFVFSDIPKSGQIVIPADFLVKTSDGLTFSTEVTSTYNENQLAQYYDNVTFRYRIPVPVQAIETGAKYKITTGSISEFVKELPMLDEVTNEIDFYGGVDKEDNAAFAARIQLEGNAPSLGVEKGYTAFLNQYPDAIQSRVVGFGHPLMRRDIIGTTDNRTNFTQTVREVHYGGKIDLYLRGRDLTAAVENLAVRQFNDGEVGVILSKTPLYDIIQVKKYDLEGELTDPNIDQSLLYVTDYIIDKEEDFETELTREEDVRLLFIDNSVEVGQFVEVQYRYNALLDTIYNDMFEEDNRPPASDIKLKEAPAKKIFAGLVAKGTEIEGLSDRERLLIKDRIKDFVNAKPLGEDIQFSDIQASLTQESYDNYTVNFAENSDYLGKDVALKPAVVDYIRLPSTVFLVTKNDSDFMTYTMSKAQRLALTMIRQEQGALTPIIDRYQDRLRTYDFFDVLHALMFEEGLNNALTEISSRGENWPQLVEAFNFAKELFDTSLITKRLLPSRIDADYHEHFEVGEVFLYDEKSYDAEDWSRILTVVRDIALPDNQDSLNFVEFSELTLYMIILSWIITTGDEASDNLGALYEYLFKITDRTPLRNMIELRSTTSNGFTGIQEGDI